MPAIVSLQPDVSSRGHTNGWRSVVKKRTTRHLGYAASQRIRERIVHPPQLLDEVRCTGSPEADDPAAPDLQDSHRKIHQAACPICASQPSTETQAD
jgi:hypothetical protein